MDKNFHKTEEPEQIQLLRGGSIVSSLSSAFGRSLRETRLTALLGYLIALKPEHLIRRFGFRGRILSVSLETLHATDRSDILVKTTEGTGLIEAKTDATDPLKQAMKYPANWHALLTEYIPTKKQKKLKRICYLRWGEVSELLQNLARSSNPQARFVANDLLKYLEEHNMIRTKETVEIYAREINEEISLALFLHAEMYACGYEKGSRLPEALYFAPHFGQRIAKKHPGVQVGISYIARIETVEVVETWNNFLRTVAALRGKAWLNRKNDLLAPIHKTREWKKGRRRYVLFLSSPRLVFNPPVKKENLQKGKGWLSKRFLSFDELFKAWGC